jgi:hypothetical protein
MLQTCNGTGKMNEERERNSLLFGFGSTLPLFGATARCSLQTNTIKSSVLLGVAFSLRRGRSKALALPFVGSCKAGALLLTRRRLEPTPSREMNRTLLGVVSSLRRGRSKALSWPFAGSCKAGALLLTRRRLEPTPSRGWTTLSRNP